MYDVNWRFGTGARQEPKPFRKTETAIVADQSSKKRNKGSSTTSREEMKQSKGEQAVQRLLNKQ